MKRFFALLLLILSTFGLQAQSFPYPELALQQSFVEGHMRFLASDALQGRRTGEPGNNMAAHYLASYFEAYGLKKAPGMDSYLQSFNLENRVKPASGHLKIAGKDYKQGSNLLLLSGAPANAASAKVVFANHGMIDPEKGIDDYAGLDVKGKVVLVLAGTQENSDFQTVFRMARRQSKQRIAAEKGALALIEIYTLSYPWDIFSNLFGGSRPTLKSDGGEGAGSSLAYGWLNEPDKAMINKLSNMNDKKVSFASSGAAVEDVPTQNVIGWIEGTDPELKDEFVVLTAHYDHVGTGKSNDPQSQDTIFNGARDNGLGTVSVLAAAKSLVEAPTKRSVLLIALTGEEIGLLGARYYTENPVVPLEKTIFNLNSDNAGYNDTELISIIGFGRTGTDQQVKTGVEAVGLKVFPDPAPEQGLFDRSDNVQFASKGVPCITFSGGFKDFDAELSKYYHQVTDDADSLDFGYVLKYCQSYAHVARWIANMEGRPVWAAGDKYEAAGKELYKN
ncbi:MAG: M28 family peptidase [Saprospiraceae bacterium]|nr:M28 family peptidase [Saprospiraceae bacterium]